MARLKSNIKGNRSALVKQFGYKSVITGAAFDQDRGQHGCWAEAVGDKKILEYATKDLTAIVGPEAGHHQGQDQLSRTTRFVKAIRLAPWRRCATSRCTEFLVVSSTSRCRVRDFRGISPRGFDVAATSISV